MKTGRSKPEGNYFEASDGHRLFYEDALGDRDSSAPLTVLFLHGVHESADTLTAQRLLEGVIARGHRFVALEQHGHGRSSGPRGLVQSMSTLVRHATEFVHFLMLAGSRVVVIGHSMGGAVAAFMGSTLRQQYGGCFLGVILINPSLSGPTPNWLTRSALSGLCVLWSSAPVGPPESTDEYDTGSNLGLNYSGRMQACTCQMFVDLFLSIAREGGESCPDLSSVPFLVLHGTKDRVCPLGRDTIQTRIYQIFLAQRGEDISAEFSQVVEIPEGHQPFGRSVKESRWRDYLNRIIKWIEAADACAKAS